MDKELEEIIICQCHSAEHQMIVRSIDGDVYLTFHLSKLPFWKRLKNGIKYIFGYTSKYGDFEDIIVKPTDYVKFHKITDFLKKGLNSD